MSCQQIHLSQSCLRFCCVSRSTSCSLVSAFVVSADPPPAVLCPLLSCQQIHLSQSCHHFCCLSRFSLTFAVSADPPLAVLFPLLSCKQIHLCHHFFVSADSPLAITLLPCQQIHLSQFCFHLCNNVSIFTSQFCFHFCHVSRSSSQSCVHFVVSADPHLAVLSPLLSCQQIHPSQSCLHFCRVSRSTSRSPVSTFVMSADPPLAVPSPLLLCQQIHLSQVHFCRISRCALQSCLHFCHISRFTSRSFVSTFVVSADPPLAVLSPLLSCQQIHHSQSCLHFRHVSRSTSQSCLHFVSADPLLAILLSYRHIHLSPTFVMSADPPLAVLSPLFVVSVDPPLAVLSPLLSNQQNRLAVLSPLLSCQHIHLTQSCLHLCRVMSADPPLAVLSPLMSCHVSRSTSRSTVSTMLCQQIHLSQ